MKLAAYEIVESSPTRFSIRNSRTVLAWLLSITSMITALVIFLLLHGFDQMIVTTTLLVLPVVIAVVVLGHGLTPFSITVEQNGIVIVRKWIGKFTQTLTIEKERISTFVAQTKSPPFSIFHQGSIEALSNDEKRIRIFSVVHSSREAAVKEICFLSGEFVKILSLPIDKDNLG